MIGRAERVRLASMLLMFGLSLTLDWCAEQLEKDDERERLEHIGQWDNDFELPADDLDVFEEARERLPRPCRKCLEAIERGEKSPCRCKGQTRGVESL